MSVQTQEPTGAETGATPDQDPTAATQIWSGSETEPNSTGVNPENGGEQQTGVPTSENTPVVTQPNVSAMTPEQIAQIASQTALQTQQAQQAQQAQQQPRQYTAEELNLFEMNEQLFQQMFESEDKAVAIEAFNTMAQGIAKQAYTMASLQFAQQMDQRFGQLDERLSPHLQFAQQQQEAVMAQQFFAKYPDLQGMDSVVNQVTAQLRQEGAQFQTTEQLFGAVAQRTQAIIQTISGQQNPQQVPGQGQTPQQGQPPVQQTPQKPPMAAVGAGGTGGAGGGQQGNASKPNAAKAIFGPAS